MFLQLFMWRYTFLHFSPIKWPNSFIETVKRYGKIDLNLYAWMVFRQLSPDFINAGRLKVSELDRIQNECALVIGEPTS